LGFPGYVFSCQKQLYYTVCVQKVKILGYKEKNFKSIENGYHFRVEEVKIHGNKNKNL